MLRIAEMRESLKIIKQAMEKITDHGEIQAEAAGIIPPQREKNEDGDGSAHLPFQNFHRRFFAPSRRSVRHHRISARELGCFIASDGSPKPLRCHFRSPSYINLQLFRKIVEGQIIADVVACIGTIDIVLGEVDR